MTGHPSHKEATPEEFVLAWQAAKTSREVAEKLGIDVEAANQRARAYRLRGVKLKCFRRGREAVDVATLNRIIEESANDHG